MSDVDAFLAQNPDLKTSDEKLGSGVNEIRLHVTVGAISPGYVEFNYLGTNFKVDRKDVLGLDEVQDPSATGKAATLKLKRDALLLTQQSVSASELASPLPFSLARPSPLPAASSRAQSPREIAWRKNAGFGDPWAVTFLATGSGSATETNGMSDDSGFDDCKFV
jgi:hypothetical protein